VEQPTKYQAEMFTWDLARNRGKSSTVRSLRARRASIRHRGGWVQPIRRTGKWKEGRKARGADVDAWARESPLADRLKYDYRRIKKGGENKGHVGPMGVGGRRRGRAAAAADS
jgi:hypothetical protein